MENRKKFYIIIGITLIVVLILLEVDSIFIENKNALIVVRILYLSVFLIFMSGLIGPNKDWLDIIILRIIPNIL